MAVVCLDVFETCFPLQQTIDTMDEQLGPQLEAANVSARAATFFWFAAAQRDFTYVSMAGSFAPISQVFRDTLGRALRMLGVGEISESARTAITRSMVQLKPTDGLRRGVELLRAKGHHVMAVTNGAVEGTRTNFANAGITLSDAEIVSCDVVRAAKPDPRVYHASTAAAKALSKGEPTDLWFLAAHQWDLIASRKHG